MRRLLIAAVVAALPLAGVAQNAVVVTSLEHHILPRFERFADQTQMLADVAAENCEAQSPALKQAYARAFDAWISVSHLRFGPTETRDHAFAIAFWPDSRGATPKALARLIVDEDPITADAQAYSDASIAARGLYALEFLMYDDVLSTTGSDAFRCILIQTMTKDIALMARAIWDDWAADFSLQMLEPSKNAHYRTDQEVVQELLKALSTGLQFTAETRLGRPLGHFNKPRPKRAEAWRSGRSARHVLLSLAALRHLSGILSIENNELRRELDQSVERSLSLLERLNDPVFAGVGDPKSRFRIEALRQSIETTRSLVRERLGPELGVSAGFNALDGD